MAMDDARELIHLARSRSLLLSSAPCTLLSPAAQALWRETESGTIGPIRLVYAEMEDGMVHRMPVHNWVNEAGVTWPFRDEYISGCTIEHAGYVLTWLAAILGPAESVSAFSACLVPEKIPGDPIETPDFSVGCIRFASGVVARMTNGIYAPRNHQLKIFGDEGVLELQDPRKDDSSLHIRRYIRLRRGRRLAPFARRISLGGEKLGRMPYRGSQRRDFCRGIADMAAAIQQGRRPYIDDDLSLHVNEVTLAIQQAKQTQSPVRIESRFQPLRRRTSP